MEILIERLYKKEDYTIGNLSIDGKFFCNSLEDKDRGLKSSMSPSQVQKIKVKGKTAIPTGRYPIVETYSPKFKRNMPLIDRVPGFTGVRIHWGNTAADSSGCVLVGYNKKKGMVLDSRNTFNILSAKIHMAIFNGYKVWLTIR